MNYVLGEEEFRRCFSFSLVKNLWDRMASRYFFERADNEPTAAEKKQRGTTRKFHNLDFDSWVRRERQRHRRGRGVQCQLNKLLDLKGRVLVDYVGRLESIQDALDYICQKIDGPRRTMPHVNGTRMGHYSHIYSASTRAMVEEICQIDIDYFGYSFEEHPRPESL